MGYPSLVSSPQLPPRVENEPSSLLQPGAAAKAEHQQGQGLMLRAQHVLQGLVLGKQGSAQDNPDPNTAVL